MSKAAILSRPVAVAEIASSGLGVDFAAGPRQREALAAAYDLVAVKALSVSATLTREVSGGVSVSGRVVGDIVQTCVVSLVPVEQHIDEPIDTRFVPPGSADLPKPGKPGAEVMIAADQPDPPEALEGSEVDLGALAEECLVLAIDPYPRAPDATLPAEAAADDGSGDSPFAVLADLAKDPPPKR